MKSILAALYFSCIGISCFSQDIPVVNLNSLEDEMAGYISSDLTFDQAYFNIEEVCYDKEYVRVFMLAASHEKSITLQYAGATSEGFSVKVNNQQLPILDSFKLHVDEKAKISIVFSPQNSVKLYDTIFLNLKGKCSTISMHGGFAIMLIPFFWLSPNTYIMYLFQN